MCKINMVQFLVHTKHELLSYYELLDVSKKSIVTNQSKW